MSSEVLKIAEASALKKQMFATAPGLTVEDRLKRLEGIILPEFSNKENLLLRIRTIVSVEFQIPIGRLISRDRMEHIAWARFTGIHLAKRLGFFAAEIATTFGLTDVHSIRHAVIRVCERKEHDAVFKGRMERLEKQIDMLI